jgi:two-component sensor histidine kinase
MPEASDNGQPTPAAPRATVENLESALAAEQGRAREADHRAKNTLQLLSSLLLLASRRKDASEETRRALKAMYQRVGALAAVHRNLLDAEDHDRFDLTRLVREQVTGLAQGQGATATVRLDLDAVAVAPALAAPLALIVNELTLNALTHAGRNEQAPLVEVSLRALAGGFVLAVKDDGPGPAAISEDGFGLTIVKLLARQIAALFVIEPAQSGLRAIVTVE